MKSRDDIELIDTVKSPDRCYTFILQLTINPL